VDDAATAAVAAAPEAASRLLLSSVALGVEELVMFQRFLKVLLNAHGPQRR
jgi:hypothetical protein